MDVNRNELRRDLRGARREQAGALATTQDLFTRLMDDETISAEQRQAVLSGPVARRRFLKLSGLSVASAAVLAACGGQGSQGQVPVAGTGPTTTKAPDRVVNDATYLRTSTSLEYSLIDAYTKMLALGTLPNELSDAFKTFKDQHGEHADLFAKLTTAAGEKVTQDPNTAVQAAVVQPALDYAAKDGNKPQDLLAIAIGLETLAAETFQQFTPLLSVPKLRSSIMSVGGVEARHAAILIKAAPTGLPVDTSAITAAASGTTTTSSTTVAGTTTTATGQETAENAPVYQVPGPFQPLTSVQITIGINTINVEPLGPNSYVYVVNVVD
jgi:hypothetical protein